MMVMIGIKLMLSLFLLSAVLLIVDTYVVDIGEVLEWILVIAFMVAVLLAVVLLLVGIWSL